MLTEKDLYNELFSFSRMYKLDINKLTSQSNYDFSVILSNGSKLQRDYVWKKEQENDLLDSVIRRQSDIGYLFFIEAFDLKNGERASKIEVIDGQHRIKTLVAFRNGSFPYILNGNTYYYNDLDDDTKKRFLSFEVTYRVIDEYVYAINSGMKIWKSGIDKIISDKQKIELLDLVSFKGTPQNISHIENLKKQIV